MTEKCVVAKTNPPSANPRSHQEKLHEAQRLNRQQLQHPYPPLPFPSICKTIKAFDRSNTFQTAAHRCVVVIFTPQNAMS